MVLVGLFPDNDFSNETYEANYRVAIGRQPAEPVRPWYERLYVSHAYLGRIRARLRKIVRGAPPPAQAGDESAAGWDKNVAALQTIADIARRQELALAVAVLPHTWHFERQRPLFARVENMCRQHGLGCLNLLEPFIARRIEEPTLRLNRLDAHPNEKYNAVVAEELAPHVDAVLRDAEAGDGLRLAGLGRVAGAKGAQ
jgi:hypothetical protein